MGLEFRRVLFRSTKEQMMECIRARGRDNARTPMQWDCTAHAGFTTGTPWIEVNSNYSFINAKEQLNRSDSVLQYYKKLIQLRHENPIMVYGQYELLLKNSETVFAYRRTFNNMEWIVLCNFTDRLVKCKYAFVLDRKVIIRNYDKHLEGKLQPYETIVYEIERGHGK